MSVSDRSKPVTSKIRVIAGIHLLYLQVKGSDTLDMAFASPDAHDNRWYMR